MEAIRRHQILKREPTVSHEATAIQCREFAAAASRLVLFCDFALRANARSYGSSHKKCPIGIVGELSGSVNSWDERRNASYSRIPSTGS